MEIIVDWLSFTVAAPQRSDGQPQYLDATNARLCARQALGQITKAIGGQAMLTLFPQQESLPGDGRSGYRWSLVNDESRTRVFFSPYVDNILIEISGIGCKALTRDGHMDTILVEVGPRMTRLDLSADIHTETSPEEFVAKGHSPKFRSTMRVTSEAGESYYVGSPTSDRRAIVYRYNDPHPRHHLLRVEHRFRRQAARDMAQYISEHGFEMAITACGELYQWNHPDWRTDWIEPVPLPRVTVEARDSNVARWLLTQVFPAMRRYEREGKIPDLQAFVQAYLFDEQAYDSEDISD